MVHYSLQLFSYVLGSLWIRISLMNLRQHWGKAPSVASAANIFQKVCYDNKDALSAGIIVAGWDAEEGGSVYNIPLGGGLFRQPWAIGGEYSFSFT